MEKPTSPDPKKVLGSPVGPLGSNPVSAVMLCTSVHSDDPVEDGPTSRLFGLIFNTAATPSCNKRPDRTLI